MKNYLLIIIATVVMFGCADLITNSSGLDIENKQPVHYTNLPKQHFINSLNIRDDNDSSLIFIDTKKGYSEEKAGLRLKSLSSQNYYLEAILDKISNKATYSVHGIVRFNGKRPTKSKYAVYGHNKDMAETRHYRKPRRCQTSTRICNYTEHFAFIIKAEAIEAIQAANAEDGNGLWDFRVVSEDGTEISHLFTYHEFAAVFDAVTLLQKNKR